MSKKAFDNIMKGLQEVLAHVEGDESVVHRVVHVKPADIKTARKKVGLSRDDFASLFG